MNILHINCNYMTTSLHQKMIEELDDYTNNTVFCPVIKNCIPVINPNENVVSVECFDSIDRLLYFKKQDQIFKSIEKNIEVPKYDLIHAYTLMTDGNCAMKLSQKYGKPYVVAVRDTDINYFFKLKPYLIPLGIKIMERAERIFFLSESYKKQMLDKFVPKKKRVFLETKMMVIPNGIDDFWLEHAYKNRDVQRNVNRIKNKQLNIVCVGQIIKRKNIPLIQRALKKLKDERWDVHLDVIGKRVDRLEYQKIIADLDTSYYNPIAKDKLIDFYRNNDIFILVSHTETFGLVYAEAMSQGLPVIYTKGQGFDGQFPEGMVGYAADDKNEESIVDAVKKITDRYTELSNNALECSKIFKWKDICSTYKQIYKSIIFRSNPILK